MAGSNFILGGAVVALIVGSAAPVWGQTWGQPAYVPAPAIGPWAGGAYAATGRLATGYAAADYDRGYYVTPTQGRGYAQDRGGRYGWSDARGHGYRAVHGQDYPRHDSGRRAGYRDWYGYDDDRPPSRYGRHDHGCDCADVYLYDR